MPFDTNQDKFLDEPSRRDFVSFGRNNLVTYLSEFMGSPPDHSIEQRKTLAEAAGVSEQNLNWLMRKTLAAATE
jgi:hypothetical protein|tara:strand:- start:4408 stop:4629 length:222 start_codon:yes stop_codon:yes gene_type:complete